MASHNSLHWDGLEELKSALRNLPSHLTAEAAALVIAAGTGAKAEIVAAYPIGPTGNLRRGVTTQEQHSQFGVTVMVKSRANHAWIFENGTRRRQTDTGANRGEMPAKHIFIPIMTRRRRAMYEALNSLLTRNGLVVSGKPS